MTRGRAVIPAMLYVVAAWFLALFLVRAGLVPVPGDTFGCYGPPDTYGGAAPDTNLGQLP